MSVRKRLLFVCYGAGHVAMCIPVISALTSKGDAQREGLDIRVLGLTTAASALRREGIDCIGYADVARIDARVEEYGRSLARGLGANAIDSAESIAYLGTNYAELVDTFGAEEAAQRYQQQGRQSFLPVRFFERLLIELGIDLVVATSSPRSEQAAILAAGRQGVRSVCLVDLFAIQERAWVGEHGYANRVCVLSEAVAKLLVEAGRHRDEIEVTGNPAFDRLADERYRTFGEALRKVRGWGDRKVLLWASSAEPPRHPFTGIAGDPGLPGRVDAALTDLARRRPELQIVVRFHPNETARALAELPNVSISSPSEELAVILHASDAVVVTGSTVGLEAALLGKPVISLEQSIFAADAPYAALGMARGVPALCALEEAIDEVLQGSWRPTGELPQLGRATQRVVRVVSSLV